MSVAVRAARLDEAERVLEMYEWLFAAPGATPPEWDPDRGLAAILETIDPAGRAGGVDSTGRAGAIEVEASTGSGAVVASVAPAATAPSALLVAEADSGELVGFCSAYIDLNSIRFGRRCWVEDLAVDPGRRSQGIGEALLDRAREWARSQDATHLELDSGEARPDAHRFYERLDPSWRGYQYAWWLGAES